MNTDGPDFDTAEQKARDLRLIQKSDSLSLDVRTMEFDLPIVIDTYQHYAELTGITVERLEPDKSLQDGYTIIDDDIYLVLYNADVSNSEHLNWTLAHEVGHIYMGHESDGKIQEIEAHWFAAELLAPESLIRSMAHKTRVRCDTLQYIFGLSFTAANKRIDGLNRKCAWQTYKEHELIAKYKETMDNYINRFTNVLEA
jgi:Zn-dependent peptidase ImmA (M78 family)